jgi:epoxide hydrolase A/B
MESADLCMETLLSASRLDRMRQELFHRERGNAMAKDHTPVHLDGVSHRCIETNGLRIHMAEQGTGPLLLLCHGFPELWYSWRKQIPVLAEAGYHVVALDMRGYGQTDQPAEQGAYTLLHLVGDLVGVLEALGESHATLIGHDWGSNVCWQAALMRPDLFPVLVTMSSPYIPRRSLQGAQGTLRPTQGWQQRFKDQFFYQLYFQEPGVAEVALERDVATTMRQFLCGASGDASASERWHPVLSEQTDDPLAHVGLPASLPPWLTEADLAYYSQEFSRTGFTGGLNWYRNTDRNWELLAAYSNAQITQPTLFVCGARDPVFELVGPDTWIEQMRLWVPAIQTKVLPDGGHWIQQERAEEVNAALLTFLQEQTIARGVNAERQA